MTTQPEYIFSQKIPDSNAILFVYGSNVFFKGLRISLLNKGIWTFLGEFNETWLWSKKLPKHIDTNVLIPNKIFEKFVHELLLDSQIEVNKSFFEEFTRQVEELFPISKVLLP